MLHIAEPGTVMKYTHACGKKGGRQNGQDAVFSPLDPDGPGQGAIPLDPENAHDLPSL